MKEMDFQASSQEMSKRDPAQFAVIRATEPHFPDYTSYHTRGYLLDDISAAGFWNVSIAAASAKHFITVGAGESDLFGDDVDEGW